MSVARRLLMGGSGGIVLPTFNDEFSGANVDWTVAGSNDVEFDGGTHPGNVFLESGMAIHRASIPSMPFTVTAFCSDLLFDDIYTTFGASMLAVGGSTNPGSTGPHFYAIQWDVAFLGEIGVIDGVYEDYATQTFQNPYVKLGDDLAFQVPHYLRLVVNSDSDISSYTSLNGTDWTLFEANFDPNLGEPIDSVLLLAFGCEAAFDWLRFS